MADFGLHTEQKMMQLSIPSVESFLWLCLAAALWMKDGSSAFLILLICCLVLFVSTFQHSRPFQNTALWRMTSHNSGAISMSLVLVPVLLYSMGKKDYARGVFAGVVLAWNDVIFVPFYNKCCYRLQQRKQQTLRSALEAIGLVALVFSIVWKGKGVVLFGVVLQSHEDLIVLTVWGVLYQIPLHARVLRKVVTKAEWILISSLSAFTLAECWLLSSTSSTTVDDSHLYAYTAVAGLLGCGMACATVDYVVSSLQANSNALVRLIYVAVVALGTVEGFFWKLGVQSQQGHYLPTCLWWIFGDFLLAVETPLDAPSWIPASLQQLPRMAWLVYWGVCMAIAIPLAPVSNNENTILARKWFHLVAVLLFVPTTILAPQLMALSYAIALAVLMVLESTRHCIPLLNDFYKNYLDTSKEEHEDSTIISHMALIVGCAAPLWLALYSNTNISNIMPTFGIWTLGVGDAMGAIIGKRYGKLYWGHDQGRTVEGSLAMFLSLSLVVWDTRALPAILFVTLLEAFTTQIDNLVLPLAGATVLFLVY